MNRTNGGSLEILKLQSLLFNVIVVDRNEECTSGNDEKRKLDTVYSMHELCYCTGWSTVDGKEECTV